jgi:hypothetical protein
VSDETSEVPDEIVFEHEGARMGGKIVHVAVTPRKFTGPAAFMTDNGVEQVDEWVTIKCGACKRIAQAGKPDDSREWPIDESDGTYLGLCPECAEKKGAVNREQRRAMKRGRRK